MHVDPEVALLGAWCGAGKVEGLGGPGVPAAVDGTLRGAGRGYRRRHGLTVAPAVGGQGRHERLLWHLHPADVLHPLLAFLLPLQQFAFPGDVTAIALGQHVLADGADRFPGDDARADRRLDGHLELLPRDRTEERTS